jgi:hypothetical protein
MKSTRPGGKTPTNSVKRKREELLYLKRHRRNILSKAFERLRSAKKRRTNVENLTSRIARLSISSPPRPKLTEEQARNFYRLVRPLVKREIKRLRKRAIEVGASGPAVRQSVHENTWQHTLPSRYFLEKNIIKRFDPNRVREGSFVPEAFDFSYRMSSKNRKRDYNRAVNNTINRFVLDSNRNSYRVGDTPSRYRKLYENHKKVTNFVRAFKNWELAILSTSNLTKEQKNQKVKNLYRKLNDVRVLKMHNFLNINNKLANYHSALPNSVKPAVPLTKSRLDRITGSWNKPEVKKLIRYIHTLKRR